jgi:hypothetical protein
MEVGEYLFKFAEEQHLRMSWYVAKVGQGRDGRPMLQEDSTP